MSEKVKVFAAVHQAGASDALVAYEGMTLEQTIAELERTGLTYDLITEDEYCKRCAVAAGESKAAKAARRG